MDTSLSTAMLAQALQTLSAGRPAEAEPLLRRLLQQDPAHPDALAALGQLAAQRRRWPEAQAWFERSLQAKPAQPRVWFACAQVREVQGRPAEAVQAFAEAAQRQPDWAAPRYQLARLLRELGQPAEALAQAQAALALAPADVDTLQLLAMLQEESGQLPAAEVTLGQALQRAPQRAALHHNLAVVLHRQGRHAAALAAHQQARALGLDAADAHYNFGNTLRALGRADEALAAYRRALAAAPQHALALYDLARLRWTQGHADFDAELLAAQQSAPALDTAPALRGLLLLKAERGDQALQAFSEAARRRPGHAPHLDGQGQALSLLGRHDEARELHLQALALAPADATLLCNAARSLYAGGYAAEALALAQRAVAIAPQDQLALALLGLGWRLTGDPRDAWLHDLAHLVGVIDLPPPPGWADMAAFNAALAEELERLHTAAQAPVDQTLRHGTQTHGQLFDQPAPLVQALRREIEVAISAWLAERRSDAAHPLLGRRSAAWRFTDSWSSRLRRGGFHTNHIHGHGWVSSCYYVQVPASVAEAADHAGWLKFGEPDLPEPQRSALPPRRFEAPRPGRLVLFPSYLWHGTVPFDEEASRLTVAFDLVPT